MLRCRPALATFALVGLCFSLSARAALFDDDEARKRIEATNQRLTQVQKQLDDRITALETQLKSQGLVELFSQVEQLKGDVAKLRGQIEVLVYEQEQQQKRQRDLYIDLDSRMRKLEAAPGPAAGAEAPAPAPAPAPAASPPPPPPMAAASNEQKAYDTALDHFKAGRYGPAIAGFNAFIKAFPKSALVPSAQYWIGNAQYAQRDFRGAIATQRQMISAHPDSLKVPDAMLSIATAQLDLGDTAAARRTLEDVVAKFPKSDAAVKAKQRLATK